jgi:hypothetical protein
VSSTIDDSTCTNARLASAIEETTSTSRYTSAYERGATDTVVDVTCTAPELRANGAHFVARSACHGTAVANSTAITLHETSRRPVTTVFTQNGYFVMLPDIVFRPREPGLGTQYSVEAAVKNVLARGLVDPNRVGHVGHSQGGYEAAFLGRCRRPTRPT